MASKARQRSTRPSTSSAMDSPTLDPKLIAGSASDLLLDEGDDSGFLDLNSKDFDKMNLVDTPPVQRIQKKAKAQFSSPGKPIVAKRPSWGPRSSPSKGKMRLLEGVDSTPSTSQPVQVRRKERTLGGLGQEKGGVGRPRQSIFAKPAPVQHIDQDDEERAGKHGKDDEGDDSFYKDTVLGSSTGSIVMGRVAAIEASRKLPDTLSTPALNGNETKEQAEGQLAELKKMNEVFEAYERMLTSSSDQIENFAQRIAETNSLLDIYIDLMRQADRTQQLLLDRDWKGATEDESAHALALELAEREKARKQEEARQAARLAAQRSRQAELARQEAEQAEQARAAAQSMRGKRGGAAVGRGAPSSMRGRGAASSTTATTRVSSAARGRTASTTTSSRGGASSTRGTSSAGGLNDRYAGVRSSGYGPPR